MFRNHFVRMTAGLIPLFTILVLAGCGSNGEQRAALKALRKQCSTWDGALVIYKPDDTSETLPLRYELSETRGRFEGRMTLETARAEGGAQARIMDVVFERQEPGTWKARIGGANGFAARVSVGPGGRPDRGALAWIGPASSFLTRFDDEAINMAIDGLLPLPGGVGSDAVWMTARLRRGGFRVTLGLFDITLMECLGIFATLVFAARFVVQWIASERAGRSVVPEFFWWVSLVGAGLMMVYAVYYARFAVLLGQLTGWIVYLRNIWLIEHEKRRAHHQEEEKTLGSPEGNG